ncbi:MAG: DUF2956 domain-containing protein [Psychromonas sp.]|nr:DUF2956 domain-containing protein [Psychromonas sp.]
MAKNSKQTISDETVGEALAVAKKTQKPGQTKEQTRLIALGIQKGITDYKKSAKAKQRQADKAQKKQKKQKLQNSQTTEAESITPETNNKPLPWILLVTSWALFALYLFTSKA